MRYLKLAAIATHRGTREITRGGASVVLYVSVLPFVGLYVLACAALDVEELERMGGLKK